MQATLCGENTAATYSTCGKLVYRASQFEADAQVGRLLDSLDDLGLSNTTMVIFSGDNGPEVQPCAPGSTRFQRGGEGRHVADVFCAERLGSAKLVDQCPIGMFQISLAHNPSRTPPPSPLKKTPAVLAGPSLCPHACFLPAHPLCPHVSGVVTHCWNGGCPSSFAFLCSRCPFVSVLA